MCVIIKNYTKKIIINSYEGKNFHYQLGYQSKMYVINNGYTNKDYIDKKKSLSTFSFGMLARWDPQKDYNNLLSSIAYFKSLDEFKEISKKIKVNFVLAGHRINEDNSKLRKIINDLKINDLVKLVGDYNEEDIDDFYKSIDAHVLSSRSEGFPNVIAESMRAGVPNISTKVGDAEKIINDTGWIVEPRNKIKLANAFIEALEMYKNNESEWEKLKIKSNKRINLEYNISKMVDSFNQLWNSSNKNKGFKIFHIISGLGSGGAQTILARLVKNEKKFSHTIISFIDFGDYEKFFKKEGIKLIKLNMKKGKFSLKGFLTLCKIIKEERPDIIQTWMYHADFLGGLVGRFYKIEKIFWNIRNSNLKREWASISTIVISRICAYLSNSIPTKIISCSKKSKDVHIEFGYKEEKISIINNGYDTSQMIFKNKNRDKIFKIGMLARWDPQKDYLNLAKSLIHFNKLTKRKWIVYLAGDKIDKNNKKLLEIFEHKELKNNIIYDGMISDIASFFDKIDLHILSSAGNEGFPNVVAEAMGFGVPCISTDVGDPKYILISMDG